MNWHFLTELSQIEQIILESQQQLICVFKHSTRCAISSTIKDKLERNYKSELDSIKFYYLDLIQHREISNTLAEHFKVYHESPQILMIKNGDCYFDASHYDISVNEIIEQL